MAIIKAPNDQYTGVSASVFFVNGEGETDDPKLIEWFKEKGYTVIENEKPEDDKQNFSELTNAELKALLDEKGIEYNARSNKETLLKLLNDVE